MQVQALDRLRNLNGPVLITGHTGFKGMWLTLLLESYGIEVTGISLKPEQDSLYSRIDREGKIYEKFLDIRDFRSLTSAISSIKPSVVFHMAAQPLVLQSYVDPLGTFETNVMGTANLFQAISILDYRCFVVAITTDKVYQNLETGQKFKEEDKLKGKDPYSASKVGTESVISAWKNIWRLDDSHKICAARAGNVIGGGDYASDRLIPDIVRGIQSKSLINIRNYESSRPWQHVLDPLHGYTQLADALLNDADLEGVNFGPTESSLPVSKVVEIAKEVFLESVQFSPPQNKLKVRLESELLDLDSTLAQKILGWKPKWNQETAIRMTFSWWKQLLEGKVSPLDGCKKDIELLLGKS
jgi:CDP-glucose 4,6-dehydratase